MTDIPQAIQDEIARLEAERLPLLARLKVINRALIHLNAAYGSQAPKSSKTWSRWTPSDDMRLAELAATMSNCAEIARIMDRSHITVYRYLKRLRQKEANGAAP